MPLINTIGINMPDDFPATAYNGVQNVLREYRHRNGDTTAALEWAAGWNAIARRFKAMADADIQFTKQVLKEQARLRSGKGTLLHDEQQLQEEYLFSFFLNGYSTIESFCYSVYSVGAILLPDKFPIETEGDKEAITHGATQRKYAAVFPDSPISKILTSLIPRDADVAYTNWGKLRNILAHRVAPRRHTYAHLREGPGPDMAIDRPTEWGGIALDGRTTRDRRVWLAATLRRLIDAALAFSKDHF